MIFNLSSGGASSGGLNFSVVGGTSAPSSPAENTIWINTSTSITGWAMQAEAPSGSEGLVWIKTALSGETAFNALKKNAITIAVVGCQQYVSGSWANVAAQIWQSDAWVEFSTENLVLFEAGGSYTDKWLTPGWGVTGTGTISSDAITITAAYNASCAIGTAAKISVGSFSKVKISYTFKSVKGGYIKMGLCSTSSSLDDLLNWSVSPTKGIRLDASLTSELDLSGYDSGEYYLVFAALGADTVGWSDSATITKVECV